MSTYELARRLEEIGHPILQSGVARIESGERQVSVDDLVALAIVLNCSPTRLLLPELREPKNLVPVAGDVLSDELGIWTWAGGDWPLIRYAQTEDGLTVLRAPSGPEIAAFRVANQPYRYAEPGEPDGES